MPVPEASGLAALRLKLSDFRGYGDARIDVDHRPVVLTGPNGAGKTNVLEALSLLAPGRGLRRARLTDLVRQGGGPWAVAARLARGRDEPTEVGTGLDPEGGDKRLVRIDGRPVRGQAQLAAIGAIQWLTPQMDGLFLDGAGARRRFLDRLVTGADPDHAGRLAAYEHAQRERIRLLREGRSDPTWLDALEDTMARHGVAVAAARRERVHALDGATVGTGPFPQAALRLAGTVESWLEDTPALSVEDRLRERLAENRRLDAEAGTTAEGPHRSDLEVTHVGRGQAARLCSTGEQKALLLSIQLANARLVKEHSGSAPLLLLDEVAAHLDEIRRTALFDEIRALGAQAWLTGTEAQLFRPLRGQAQFLRVTDAIVTFAGD
ncbi:MAG: DNA replication/repair protein RecF [Alphaproteobacteria bacterium]|nr:DNA replication/repair protein RecF [Alphaproteobacteria bacterium]